ncbi:MAG TPA: hypothetical protein PKE62_14085 [Anaerolineales bacterium]|nr:hypothetical protein [Anaerolineales bacterium]
MRKYKATMLAQRERAGLKPPAQYMEARFDTLSTTPSGLTLATNARSPLQRTSTH